MHVSLTSALLGGEWSASRPRCFTPGKRAPGTHLIGGWVGPIAGLDDVENITFLTLPGLEHRPLRRPARSQSLYQQRYPGSSVVHITSLNILRINIYLSIYLSMALLAFLGPLPLFQFINPIQSL
jgi:hypothetical protein